MNKPYRVELYFRNVELSLYRFAVERVHTGEEVASCLSERMARRICRLLNAEAKKGRSK